MDDVKSEEKIIMKNISRKYPETIMVSPNMISPLMETDPA